MTTTDTQKPSEGAPAPVQEPVDRKRRAKFIASVVGFCLIVAAAFTALVGWVGVAAIYLPIIEMFIGSLMSLAMATTLAYVGGSVLDYNGGIGNLVTRDKNKYVYPEAQG